MDITETKLFENFWCFEQQGVRAWLAVGTDYALLIDSLRGGDLLSLCREKTELPIKLVCTHADPDHIGASAQFESVYLHPTEFSTYAMAGGRPDVFPVWEGYTFNPGGFRFEVLLIPGHTPGSIALLEPDRRFLVGGDSVQTGPIYMFGGKRSIAAYRASMEKLWELSSRFDFVYSSHNEITVSPSVIPELRDFAEDILEGDIPDPSPAFPYLPEAVKIYSRGNAHFLLDSTAL